MDKVRVAFIGAGQFANVFHYPTLSVMDDVRLQAICDLRPELLHATADKYGIESRYTDYRMMLDREDLDAVYVVMKPQGLMPIVLDVLEAGLHAFTEKPLGMSTVEARRMAEAAEDRGLHTQVGTNRRFSPVLRAARERVLAEGPISSVSGTFHKDMKGEQFEMEVLHSDGLHVLDAMRFLAGDVEAVHGFADRWYGKSGWEHSHNVYHALIRFRSGAAGTYSANRQSGVRRERFEIHGRNIAAYVAPPDKADVYRSGSPEPEVLVGSRLAGSDDVLRTYGYFDENRDFIEAIKNDRRPQCSFQENLKTMELCDAVVSAAGHGLTVPLPTRPIITRLPDLSAVSCSCGQARRGLIDVSNRLCSLHLVDVSENARAHSHETHTEVYYVLSGDGQIEIDGVRTRVGPGAAILIPPKVRHRAVVGSKMRILNFVVPPFDPADEHEE